MPVPDWTSRQEILSGQCLLSVTLAADEVASLSLPSPYFALISREAYFSSVYADVLKHFEQFIVKSEEVWFYRSLDECPLPVHFPVGLVLDLFFPIGHTGPFPLTARFRSQPDIHCKSPAQISSVFVNQLKASLSLRDRTSLQNFNKLSKDQIIKLQSVATEPFEVSGLLEILDRQIYLHQGDSSVSVASPRIPFKIYLKPGSWDGKRPISYATGVCETGSVTLAQAVSDVLAAELVDPRRYKICAQGIEIPLEAEMMWLSLHVAGLDGWLHFVLADRNANI